MLGAWLQHVEQVDPDAFYLYQVTAIDQTVSLLIFLATVLPPGLHAPKHKWPSLVALDHV